MAPARKDKVPSPTFKSLVRDTDLREISFDQVQMLAHTERDKRNKVILNLLAPKFEINLRHEQLKDNTLIVKQRSLIENLLADYFMAICLLPLIGERTQSKDRIQKFVRQAKKFETLVANESYCKLIHALMPGCNSNFIEALTQVHLLHESLKLTIQSANKSLALFNSNQLSVEENSRDHLGWNLADIVEAGGEKLSSDSTSLYTRLLRACITTIHYHPEAEDCPDVTWLARKIISLRKKRKDNS